MKKKIVGLRVIKAGSNPDVDSDFNTVVRADAMNHVAEIYGHDNVSQVTTFGTLAAKQAIKSMCNIYQVPFAQAGKAASLIPGPIEGKEITVAEMLDPTSERYDEAEEFRAYTSGSEWAPILAGAREISGRIKSTGVHACAVIISSKPLHLVTPTMVRQSDGQLLTQWAYPELEDMGLIKMDFLGLDTVDIIQQSVRFIQQAGKTVPNMREIALGDMKDPKVYELFQNAETVGIFQFGSDMVRDLLKRMRPTDFNDLSATTALGRPGPMGMGSHLSYADRKNGREDISFIHPDFDDSPLADILSTTFGLCVPAGTPILDTTDGIYRPIEDLVEGVSHTTSLNPKTGDVENKLVAKVMETGVKRIVKVNLNGGRTIRVSADHPMFTNKGRKAAGELVAGEMLTIGTVRRDEVTNNENGWDTDSAYRAGFTFDGDSFGDDIMGTSDANLRAFLAGFWEKRVDRNGWMVGAPVSGGLRESFTRALTRVGVDYTVVPSLMNPDSDIIMPDTALFSYFVGEHLRTETERWAFKHNEVDVKRATWRKVLSVEEDGEELCYDIEVEDNHTFFVDGFAVYNCVYQEQIIKIASEIAGMTLQEGDDLRKAMGKKKVAVMEKMKPKFFEGSMKNGYSEEAVTLLWDTISEFSKYGFNKCAHGETVVRDAVGNRLRLREVYKRWENGERDIQLMSMWEDGEIRPHRVRNVVKTGKKPVVTITTESGRTIRVTEDHRLLTTSGFGTVADGGLTVGAELMVDDNEYGFAISDETDGGAGLVLRSLGNSGNPDSLKNDPVWVQRFAEAVSGRVADSRGWRVSTRLSDGRMADSMLEAAAAEYLLARGVEFELHKPVPNPLTDTLRISDFYANGIYFEMDGLGRGEQWFRDNKYGDVPFVYLNPYNFVDKIDEALAVAHAENGDKIVSISEPSSRRVNTYDVEMELEGPANFIADEIVSHNSHSVAYAINAYQTAYLKVHYPHEFMSALIGQTIDKRDKTLSNLSEARRMGISIGPVDINMSQTIISPDYAGTTGYDIVYGFYGVAGIGAEAAKTIINEREKNGKFKSVQDVIARCSAAGITNAAVYRSLAWGGAFDSFGVTRRGVVEAIPNFLNAEKKVKSRGGSLFDTFGMSDEVAEISNAVISDEEYSFTEKMTHEADVLGVYLSDHPLRPLRQAARGGFATFEKLSKSKKVVETTIPIAISNVTIKKHGKGKRYILDIDDGTDYMRASMAGSVSGAIEKFEAQENIFKLYETFNKSVPADVVKTAFRTDVLAMAPPVKSDLFMAKVSYFPARDDTQPARLRINELIPLHLDHNGMMPVRMRFRLSNENVEYMRGVFKRLPATLAKEYPGENAIHVTFGRDEEILARFGDDLARGALSGIKEFEATGEYLNAVKGVKDESVSGVDVMGNAISGSGPKRGRRAAVKTNEKPRRSRESITPVPSPHRANEKVTDAMLERMPYAPTKHFTQKSPDVAVMIEKYLGFGNYDFGSIEPDRSTE